MTATIYELEHDHDRRMKAVIDRLLAEAPRLDGDTPALECHIILRGAGAIHGALSTTPEGTLRMLSPTHVPDPAGRQGAMKTILAEQFFCYGDVVSLAIERPITATTKIIS